mmetsp:Transcript_54110/g.124033  ORF Transcript_54110/g.124033 Transcript_54110/m.124033 type:complete len:212 (+) Transcript_54110:503-1138(+)
MGENLLLQQFTESLELPRTGRRLRRDHPRCPHPLPLALGPRRRHRHPRGHHHHRHPHHPPVRLQRDGRHKTHLWHAVRPGRGLLTQRVLRRGRRGAWVGWCWVGLELGEGRGVSPAVTVSLRALYVPGDLRVEHLLLLLLLLVVSAHRHGRHGREATSTLYPGLLRAQRRRPLPRARGAELLQPRGNHDLRGVRAEAAGGGGIFGVEIAGG